MNTAVCIGDSLVEGYHWLEKTMHTLLSEKYPGIAWANCGLGSDRTDQVYARRAQADAFQPFRVVVMVGTNDCSGGVSVATIEANLQSIYTYFRVTMGYEVWACTIIPCDVDSSAKNIVRTTVNTWIMNTASNVNRRIDAWTIIRDPSDPAKRNPIYADPLTANHYNQAGMNAIIQAFP